MACRALGSLEAEHQEREFGHQESQVYKEEDLEVEAHAILQ
jgi:hypothetical protein